METIEQTELLDITTSIEFYEKELGSLLIQTATISNEFNSLGKSIQSYSSNFSDFGTQFSKEFGKSLKDVAKTTGNKKHRVYGELIEAGAEVFGDVLGGIVNLAGEAVKGIGNKWRNYKINKIKKEVLSKKQEIAYEKQEIVLNQYDHICEVFDKMMILYDKQNILISLDDINLETRIKTFQLVFYLLIRVVHTKEVYEYVLNEYGAWLDGEQSSGEKKPKIKSVIDKFTNEYKKELSKKGKCNSEEWNFSIAPLLCNLDKNEKVYSQYLLFLVDPYIFSRYMGGFSGVFSNSGFNIRIYPDECYKSLSDSCFNSISLSQISEASYKLLNLNSYFKECQLVAEKNKLNKYPKYNFFDILLDILFVAGSILSLIAIWNEFHKWGLAGMCLVWIIVLIVVQIIIRNSVIPLTYSYRNLIYEKQTGIITSELSRIKSKYNLGKLK